MAVYQNTSDFWVEASLGRLPDYSVVNKFGLNAAIASGAFEDIWDGSAVHVEPTDARQHAIASSNITDAGTELSTGSIDAGSTTTLIVDESADFLTDTVAAGDIVLNDTNGSYSHVTAVTETTLTVYKMSTGSKDYFGTQPLPGQIYRVATPASTGSAVLQISGIGSAFESAGEFIILNGTSDVDTAYSGGYRMIHRMKTILSGALSQNAGNIIATADVDGTDTAQISIGNNQTLMAIYQIPENYVAMLTKFYAARSEREIINSVCQLWSKSFGEPWNIKEVQSIMGQGSSTLDLNHNGYPVYAPRTILKVRADASGVNSGVAAGFDLLLAKIR